MAISCFLQAPRYRSGSLCLNWHSSIFHNVSVDSFMNFLFKKEKSLHGRKMHPAGLLGQRFFLKETTKWRRLALIRVFQVTKGHSSPLKKDNETRIRNELWDPKKITSQTKVADFGWLHRAKNKRYTRHMIRVYWSTPQFRFVLCIKPGLKKHQVLEK